MDANCACAGRAWATSVRDDVNPVDTTLGLVALGSDAYVCSHCGQRYWREVQHASLFHDYDEYTFFKRNRLADTDGCSQCTGPDPAAAWHAQRKEPICTLVEEPHFSIRVTACACGQRFATAFTECVDWQAGEDDQTWAVLPVSGDEVAELVIAPAGTLAGALAQLGPSRRHLLRRCPTGSSLEVCWRASGFAIGPHD